MSDPVIKRLPVQWESLPEYLRWLRENGEGDKADEINAALARQFYEGPPDFPETAPSREKASDS